MICKSARAETIYVGEAGLSGQERCDQHHYDFGKRSDERLMKVRMRDEHPGLSLDQCNFKFSATQDTECLH